MTVFMFIRIAFRKLLERHFRWEGGHKSENFPTVGSKKKKKVREKKGKRSLVPKGALRRGSTAPPSVNEPSSHSPRRSSPGTAAAYVVARNRVRGGLASVSQGSHLAHLIQLIQKTSFPARTFCKVANRCHR